MSASETEDSGGEYNSSDEFKGTGEVGPALAAKSKTSKTVTTFLEHTYALIMNGPEDVVAWSPSGKSFIIKKLDQFETTCIPKFFSHNNLSSFVRQLNFYGFKKIKADATRSGQMTVEEATAAAGNWEFKHESFIRGRQDLLRKIRRKKYRVPGGMDRRDVDILMAEMRDVQRELKTVVLSLAHLQTSYRNLELRTQNCGGPPPPTYYQQVPVAHVSYPSYSSVGPPQKRPRMEDSPQGQHPPRHSPHPSLRAPQVSMPMFTNGRVPVSLQGPPPFPSQGGFPPGPGPSMSHRPQTSRLPVDVGNVQMEALAEWDDPLLPPPSLRPPLEGPQQYEGPWRGERSMHVQYAAAPQQPPPLQQHQQQESEGTIPSLQELPGHWHLGRGPSQQPLLSLSPPTAPPSGFVYGHPHGDVRNGRGYSLMQTSYAAPPPPGTQGLQHYYADQGHVMSYGPPPPLWHHPQGGLQHLPGPAPLLMQAHNHRGPEEEDEDEEPILSEDRTAVPGACRAHRVSSSSSSSAQSLPAPVDQTY